MILLPSTAVLFFAISSFFELLCILLYALVFPKLPIVKYYRAKAASEGSKTVSADLAAGGIHNQPDKVNSSTSNDNLYLFLTSFDLIEGSSGSHSTGQIEQQTIISSEHRLCFGHVLDICSNLINFPWILI